MTWTAILSSGDQELFVSDDGDIRVDTEEQSIEVKMGDSGQIELVVDGEYIGSAMAAELITDVDPERLTEEERERLERLKEFLQEWGPTIGWAIEALDFIAGLEPHPDGSA